MNIRLLAPDGGGAAALAPPQPAPTPAPAPAPKPPPASVTDSPFAGLDSKLKLPDPAPPPPKAGDKPTPKPAAATPTPPPAPAPGGRPDPKELRAELERTKSSLQQKEIELQRLIKDHESKGKDTSALTERLQTLEAELNETRGELRKVRFEASDEYRKTYEQPFTDAADNARRVLASINVYDEAGQPIRKLNWDGDFAALYRQYDSDPGDTIDKAEKMFGKAGQVVIHHIQQLHELQAKATSALERERVEHQKRTAEETAQMATRREQFKTLFDRVNSELSESVDDYHDDPTDKELADSRNEGFAIFDAKVQTPDQQIVKNAHIRQRVAAFGPMKLKILRLEQKVADLTKEVEGYRPNPPGGKLRRPGGQTEGTQQEDWETGLKKSVESA